MLNEQNPAKYFYRKLKKIQTQIKELKPNLQNTSNENKKRTIYSASLSRTISFDQVPMKDFSLDHNPRDFHNFDLLDDGKMVMLYHNNNEKMQISICDKNRIVFKSFQFDFSSLHSMSIKAFNSSIVFDYSKMDYSPKDFGFVLKYFLSIMDTNLNMLHNKETPEMVYSIDANESTIVCYSRRNKIIVYDYQLNKLKTLGQSKHPQLGFYFQNNFKNQIVHMAFRDDKFYLLNDCKLDVICAFSGLLLKSIQVNAAKFAVNSKGELWFLSICRKKIFKYNSELNFVNVMNIENCQKAINFRLINENQIVFCGK